MADPSQADWEALKRLGRYLKGRPRFVIRYKFQEPVTHLDAWTDSDWAGCVKTRKSTNGGALMHGSHLIKSWSTTQSTIALSSGEAEFYGIVKGAAVILGHVSLMKDLGIEIQARVRTDATTGKAICTRRGLGKTRHIHTQYLWIQERVQSGDIQLVKVSTNDNVADLLTKHLEQSKVKDFNEKLSCDTSNDRHALAPRSQTDMEEVIHAFTAFLLEQFGTTA